MLQETAARETISSQLLTLAEETVKISSDTANRVAERLSPIIIPFNMPGGAPEKKAEILPAPAWPPLFDRIRDSLWGIQRDLTSINQTITSTEV